MKSLHVCQRHVSKLGWLLASLMMLAFPGVASAAGEADLVLPDIHTTRILGGLLSGQALLIVGMFICGAGLVFGLVIYQQLRRLPVHQSMREVSELI